jgi:hypothetical protein
MRPSGVVHVIQRMSRHALAYAVLNSSGQSSHRANLPVVPWPQPFRIPRCDPVEMGSACAGPDFDAELVTAETRTVDWCDVLE